MCSYTFNRERPVGRLAGLREDSVCLPTSGLLCIVESCGIGTRQLVHEGPVIREVLLLKLIRTSTVDF